MANYSCKKFSRTVCQLAKVHLLQTDRHAGRRTDGQTDDNTSTARPLLMYVRLKRAAGVVCKVSSGSCIILRHICKWPTEKIMDAQSLIWSIFYS